jgi:hypothetical protein
VTVLDDSPSTGRQLRDADLPSAKALFEEARQRRRHHRIVGIAVVAVMSVGALLTALFVRGGGTVTSPSGSIPLRGLTGCVASIEPVRAEEPHDVALWAHGEQVIGEGSLWTVRSATSVHGVQYGTGWHLKFPWYTRPNGVPRIEARRINGPGTFNYDVNRAYDARGAWNTSTLDFSVPGCWQVTGQLGASTLRFRLSVGGG